MQDKFGPRYGDSFSSLDSLDITSYLSAPNWINTPNKHVGAIYRVFIDLKDISWVNKNVEYTVTLMHKMAKIKEVFDSEGKILKSEDGNFKIQKVVDWPIASKEYTDFHKWANRFNNYNPKPINEVFQSNIRYQTEIIDETKCSINIFTQSEFQFLDRYQRSRSELSKFSLKSLFSKFFDNNEWAIDQTVEILGTFKIEARIIRCDTSEQLQKLIPCVKHMLNLFPDIKSDKGLNPLNIRCQSESSLYLNSIKVDSLSFKGDIINLNSFLTGDLKILQAVQYDTFAGVNKIYKIFKDVLAETNYKNNDYHAFLNLERLFNLEQHFKLTEFLKQINHNYLLVVECESGYELNDDIKNFFGVLFKIFKDKSNIKLILVTQKDNDLSKFLSMEAKDKLGSLYKIENNAKVKFSDLTDDSKNMFLEKEVVFQGEKVTLSKLIDNKNDKLEEIINSEILLKLIKNEKIEIGKTLPSLGEVKDYYIDRIFNRQAKIKDEFLRARDIPDLFAISNVGKNELSNLASGEKIRRFRDSDPNKDTLIRFVVLGNQNAEKEFKQFCRNYPEKIIHWLKKEGKDFVLQQSRGTLSRLRKFVDTRSTSEYPVKEISGIADRVVIISAEPGMGKSTVLTKLAEKTKESDPSLWVVRVNLNDHTTDLSKVNFGNDKDKAINFLLNIADLKTPLEKELFKRSFSHKGKIALLFDGFDEISPMYENKVIELLQILKNTEVEKLWVTTRPHMRDELEDKLGMLAYTLEPLSRENQKMFLKKFLKKNLDSSNIDERRLENYTGKLLDLLSKSIVDKEREFTGIPLQAKMLAEAFEGNFKEFYSSNQNKLSLPEKLDLLDLYQRFIQSKNEIYQEEKKKDDTTSQVAKLPNELFAEIADEKHKRLALSTLFPEQAGDLIQDVKHIPLLNKVFEKLSNEELARVGIVQTTNNELNFIHRTFAEYFAAFWFTDDENLSKPEVKNFLREQIFKEKNEVIRNFFDRILAKDEQSDNKDISLENKYEIHVAVLNNDKDKVSKLLSDQQKAGSIINSLDKAGRTPLHLAAAYGYEEIVQVLLEKLEKDSGLKDKLFDWSSITYADKGNHWCAAELLLKKGANGDDMLEATRMKNYGANTKKETLLHIAAQEGYIEFAKVLVKKGADINARSLSDMDQYMRLHMHGSRYNYNYGITPLHLAAKNGRLEVTKYLIEIGADIDARSLEGIHLRMLGSPHSYINYGSTPLHLAAENGQLDVVKYFIEKRGVDFNAKDNNGLALLHRAAGKGEPEVVKYLVEKGADFNVADKDGMTPLYRAAYRDKWDVVEYLVEKGADFNVADKDGMTPLHWAAYRDKWDVVKYLVEKGADFKVADKDSMTPLHRAAGKGELKVVEYLVEKGADFNVADKDGMTPLHWAAYRDKWDVVKYLVEKGADFKVADKDSMTPLHRAAGKGELKVVEYLVEKGADFNVVDKNGVTPLHLAAKSDKLDVVEYLADKVADINVRDEYNRTPLYSAAYRGKWKVVKHLTDKGANLNVANKDSITSLHWAAKSGKLDVVKYLIDKGAKLSVADKDGMTPFHWAAKSGKLDVVKYLVDKEVDFEVADKGGMTPLHWAASSGSLELVKYLVDEKRVDFNTKANDGSTPLHWATVSGHLELVKYLVDEKMVGFNTKANDGSTPLHWATASGHLELVKYLVDEKKGGFNTKANSDITLLDSDITPLDIAVFFNHSDIIRYFIDEKSVTSSKEDIILKFLRAGVLTEEKFKVRMRVLRGAPTEEKFKAIMEMLRVEALMKGGFKAIIGVLRENFKAITGVLRGALTEEEFKAIMEVLEEVLREEVLTEEKLKAMTRILRKEDFEVIMEELREVLTEEKFKAIKEALREENLKAIRRIMLKEKQSLSLSHPNTSSTMHNIAVVLFEQGKYDEALKAFQELLNKEKLSDPDHPNTLSTMRNIAAVLFKQGKYDEVLEAFQELLNKQKQILSSDHPGILQTQRDIDTVRLHRAASSGNLNLVKELVEKGANVNAKDAGGTPLYYAAQNGYKEIVDVLLKVDSIDVNAKTTEQGFTPLHLAAQNDYKEIVDALLKVDNIDVNAKTTEQGFTPLHLAAQNGYKEIVDVLLKVDSIDVNAKTTEQGFTPLHLAAFHGKWGIVDALVEKGADVNAKDSKNSTPLMQAAQSKHWGIAVLLLNHGAHVKYLDYNQKLELLSYASGKPSYRNVVRLLLLIPFTSSQVQSYEKQQKAFLHLSEFISNHFSSIAIKSVKQGLYIPSFEAREVGINGKCAAITRILSQRLFLEHQGEVLSQNGKAHELFLSNLQTSAELYERLAQGKQVSLREEREIFDLSKLLDTFEQQLDSPTSSLPSSLSHVKSYKQSDDLLRYIGDLTGDFAIHLVTSNHVVAIYRTGDTYVYFDSNVAFVSNLKSTFQLIRILEKAVAFAGYEIAEDGFLVEHFDVTKANDALTAKQKQTLMKPIQTERHLFSIQDQKLGPINLNGQELLRAALYDLGTKLHLKGSAPILINSDMNLNSENLLAYLNAGKISITAREYLENLRDNAASTAQEVVQTTKVIPFAGSRNEIKHAQQIKELLSSDVGNKLKSYELSNLLKSPIEKSIKALPYYLEIAKTKHWPDRLTIDLQCCR